MHPVRQRILEILKQRQEATVAELAEALDMAPVSVRYHLDVLQADDLIRADTVRREGQVGRPRQIYTLTEKASQIFPNNFAPLARGLLRQIKKYLGEEAQRRLFAELAQELATEMANRCERTVEGLPLEERLGCVVEVLSEHGYVARWQGPGEGEDTSGEAGSTHYLIRTYNCPYGGAAQDHRELCAMDLELVSNLVGCPCERVDSLAEDGVCCAYRVRAESASASFRLGATEDVAPSLSLTGGRTP